MTEANAEPPKLSIVRSFVDRVWSLIKIGYCRATNTDPETFAAGSSNTAHINIAKDPISRTDTLTPQQDFHARVATIDSPQLFAVSDEAVQSQPSLDSCIDVTDSTEGVKHESLPIESTEKTSIVIVSNVGDEFVASPWTSAAETKERYRISSSHFFDQSIVDDDDFEIIPSTEKPLNDFQTENSPLPVVENEQRLRQLSETQEERIVEESTNSTPIINNNETAFNPATIDEYDDQQLSMLNKNDEIEHSPLAQTPLAVNDEEAQDDIFRSHQPQVCHFDTKETITLNIPSDESLQGAEQVYNSPMVDADNIIAPETFHRSPSEEEIPAEPTPTSIKSSTWSSHEEDSDRKIASENLYRSGTYNAAQLSMSESEMDQEEKLALQKNESADSEDYLKQFETYRRLKFSDKREDEAAAYYPHMQVVPIASFDDEYNEISPASQQEVEIGVSSDSETESQNFGDRAISHEKNIMDDDNITQDNHFFQPDHSNIEINVLPPDLLNQEIGINESAKGISQSIELSNDTVSVVEQLNRAQEIALDQLETRPYGALPDDDIVSERDIESVVDFGEPNIRRQESDNLEDENSNRRVSISESTGGDNEHSPSEEEIRQDAKADYDDEAAATADITPDTDTFIRSDTVECRWGSEEVTRSDIEEEEYSEQEIQRFGVDRNSFQDDDSLTMEETIEKRNVPEESIPTSLVREYSTESVSKQSEPEIWVGDDNNPPYPADQASFSWAMTDTSAYGLSPIEHRSVHQQEKLFSSEESDDGISEGNDLKQTALEATPAPEIHPESQEKSDEEFEKEIAEISQFYRQESDDRNIKSLDTALNDSLIRRYDLEQVALESSPMQVPYPEASYPEAQITREEELLSNNDMEPEFNIQREEYFEQEAEEEVETAESLARRPDMEHELIDGQHWNQVPYPDVQLQAGEESAEDAEVNTEGQEAAEISRANVMRHEEEGHANSIQGILSEEAEEEIEPTVSLGRMPEIEHNLLEGHHWNQVPYPEVQLSARDELTEDPEEDTEEQKVTAMSPAYKMNQGMYGQHKNPFEEEEAEEDIESGASLGRTPEIEHNLFEGQHWNQIPYPEVQLSGRDELTEGTGEQEMPEVPHANFVAALEINERNKNSFEQEEEVIIADSLARMPDMQHNELPEGQHWNHVPYPELQMENEEKSNEEMEAQQMINVSDAEVMEKEFHTPHTEFPKPEETDEEEETELTESLERRSEMEHEPLGEQYWNQEPFPEMQSAVEGESSEMNENQDAGGTISRPNFVEQDDAGHFYDFKYGEKEEDTEFAQSLARMPEIQHNELLEGQHSYHVPYPNSISEGERQSDEGEDEGGEEQHVAKISNADLTEEEFYAQSTKYLEAEDGEEQGSNRISEQRNARPTEDRYDTDQQIFSNEAAEINELEQSAAPERVVDNEEPAAIGFLSERELNKPPFENAPQPDDQFRENYDYHIHDSTEIQTKTRDVEEYGHYKQLPLESYSDYAWNSSPAAHESAEKLQHEQNSSIFNEPPASEEGLEDVKETEIFQRHPDVHEDEFDSPANSLAYPDVNQLTNDAELETQVHELYESEKSPISVIQNLKNPGTQQFLDYTSGFNDGDKEIYNSVSRAMQYSISDPQIRQTSDCNPQPYLSDEEHDPIVEEKEETNPEAPWPAEPMPTLVDFAHWPAWKEGSRSTTPTPENSANLLRTSLEDEEGEPMETEYNTNNDDVMQTTVAEDGQGALAHIRYDSIQNVWSASPMENPTDWQINSVQASHPKKTEEEFVMDDQLTEDVADYAQVSATDRGKVWQRNSASYYSIANPSDSEDDAEEFSRTESHPQSVKREAFVAGKEEQAIQQIVSDVLRSVEAEFSVLP